MLTTLVMTSLIVLGISSLILLLLIWVVYQWGKADQQKESLDETIEIKDKQLRTRKPTRPELIDRMREGGF